MPEKINQEKVIEQGTPQELAEVRKLFLRIALVAGKKLRHYFQAPNLVTRKKIDESLVTEADDEVDAYILREVRKAYPQAQILTEETAPPDFQSLHTADRLVIVDPLDGSTNFSRGVPHFAISIALVERGLPLVSLIHLPLSGEVFSAQANQPEAMLNNQRIRVSTTDSLNHALVSLDWPYNKSRRPEVVQMIQRFSQTAKGVYIRGSAVTELATLARGGIDVFTHLELKPWDVAAAALLIQKAGGQITTAAGKEWDVFEPSILASNGRLHAETLNILG